MRLNEALKKYEEYKNHINRRIVNKKTGEIAVVSNVLLDIGNEEPIETFSSAVKSKIDFPTGLSVEVLDFLKMRDCEVAIIVDVHEDKWNIPLYQYIKTYISVKDFNIKKIKRLKNFIRSYTGLLSKIVNDMSKVDSERNVGRLNSLFLQRYYYNSIAIARLLNDFEKDFYFNLPISLILRTCMLDFLIFFYFMKIVKDNKSNTEKIDEEICKYLVSNLHHLKSYYDEKLNNSELTEQEHDKIWDYLRMKYPESFDRQTKELIYRYEPKPSKIFNILSKDEDFKWASAAYEHYNYLSKYEHIGILTFELQDAKIIDDGFDINRIIDTILLFFSGVDRLIEILPHKSKYKDSLDKIIRIGKRLHLLVS